MTEEEKKDISGFNIHQRIAEIKKKVPYVQKDGTVGDMYSIVTHDKVVEALSPYMLEFGVNTVPTVKEWKREGNQTFVFLSTEFINTDNPEDRFTVDFLGQGNDKSDKGPSKATTYAKKTTLINVFNLQTGDSPDENNPDSEQDPISEEQYINLRAMCEEYGFPVDETLQSLADKIYQLKDIKELPMDMYNDALDKLAGKAKKVT